MLRTANNGNKPNAMFPFYLQWLIKKKKTNKQTNPVNVPSYTQKLKHNTLVHLNVHVDVADELQGSCKGHGTQH